MKSDNHADVLGLWGLWWTRWSDLLMADVIGTTAIGRQADMVPVPNRRLKNPGLLPGGATLSDGSMRSPPE